MRHIITSMAALLASVALIACPDTDGRYDDFVERSDPLRLEPVAGECSAPMDMSGEYVMSVAVVVSPATPILVRGTFTVDLGANEIHFTGTPLRVADRGPSSSTIEATSALEGDGSFVLDFGSILVPGDANPILPDVDVTADLRLEGCTSAIDFVCGLALGSVTSPTTLPLDGSTWAAVLLDADDDITAIEPVTTCPSE